MCINKTIFFFVRVSVLTGVLWGLSACSITQLPDNLPVAMAEQSDPDVIRAGAPTYMILLDALIKGDPYNEDYLLGGAKLYGMYASVFTQGQPKRAQLLSTRSLAYAKRAVCEELEELCLVLDKPMDEFNAAFAELDEDDVPIVYGLASAWAGSIQANTGDWLAIAQVPKVKRLIQFVLDNEENYDNGMAHLYMAVLQTQLPPSLGGKPEQAKKHFERAIALSDNQNLMAKVLYAKQYARLLYLKPLHQKLLKEVLEAPVDAGEFTLPNALAKKQAEALLAQSSEYFD